MGVLALVAGLALLTALQSAWPGQPLFNGLLACGLAAAIIALHAACWQQVWRRPSTGLGRFSRDAVCLRRVGFKGVGLAASVAPVGIAYILFPEYNGSFYEPYWQLLLTAGPWVLAVTPFYLAYVDGMQRAPEDIYWQVGRAVLGRGRPDSSRLVQHYGAWAIKGFFLPLMVVYLARQIEATTRDVSSLVAGAPLALYDFCYGFMFLVDLLFCVMGYSLTLRVLDSHVRSVEPTAFGWIVALVCYQPFWGLIGAQYLYYQHGLTWGPWLSSHSWLQALWGACIIALLAVYALSTVSFGLRFSNLTHRGIITDGPYRWLKHPAYVSKNLSWWLIAVPFVPTGDPWGAAQACALLVLLNLIYVFRARTEERHLSADPVYRDYCEWIAEHGLVATLRRGLFGHRIRG